MRNYPGIDDYSDHDSLEADDEDFYGDNNDNDIDLDDPALEEDEVEADDMDDEIRMGLRRVDAVAGFFQHNKEPVYTLAMHPTKTHLVLSGGGDDSAFVWNADTGESIKELSKHTDSVVASGFSHDGTYLATGGMDGRIFVYTTSTGAQILELDGPAEVTWLTWHPRGNALLCGSTDGTLWMWNIPSGQCMNVFTGHSSSVTCGMFTPDGKSIVSGGEDGNLYCWDPKTAAPKTVFRSDDVRFLNGASITSISVHHESGAVLAGGQDGNSCLVTLGGNGRILGSVSKCEDSIESVGFSPHLQVGAVSSIDGSIAIWDLDLMRLRQTLRHNKGVTKVLFLKSSPLLLSCSLDKTVRLWDLRTGRFERAFYGHSGPILDMVASQDGERIVSCGEDGSAQVFTIL